MVLPKGGHYYFDARDPALVGMFETLGIRSLRIGGNSVDDPTIAVPQEADIDALFGFARAAGVKVIYSFRLKNGDTAEAVRLARHIAAHYADLLDCFAIGNEPNFYLKPYSALYAAWKPRYDAILQAVPAAVFDGPSADGPYALRLAQDAAPLGHFAMASDHYYFIGSGRQREQDPPAARALFLSDENHAHYEADYQATGAVLARRGVPYRIDELNSCYNGGARDSSDTFASSLWALDCLHWWAAHHLLGMNFHTGESVGRDGVFGPPNYAAFLRSPDGHGFDLRPQGYAYLAFTTGAHGTPLAVQLQKAATLDFDAYAFRDRDGTTYVTLINKSYGPRARDAAVSLRLPHPGNRAQGERMDLRQAAHDVAAKTGVTLGGAAVDPAGHWNGAWTAVEGGGPDTPTIDVPAASAVVLRYGG